MHRAEDGENYIEDMTTADASKIYGTFCYYFIVIKIIPALTISVSKQMTLQNDIKYTTYRRKERQNEQMIARLCGFGCIC